jgi:hypothetical protein
MPDSLLRCAGPWDFPRVLPILRDDISGRSHYTLFIRADTGWHIAAVHHVQGAQA